MLASLTIISAKGPVHWRYWCYCWSQFLWLFELVSTDSDGKKNSHLQTVPAGSVQTSATLSLHLKQHFKWKYLSSIGNYIYEWLITATNSQQHLVKSYLPFPRTSRQLEKKEYIQLPVFKLVWEEDEVKPQQYQAMLKRKFQTVNSDDDSEARSSAQSQSCGEIDIDRKNTAAPCLKLNRIPPQKNADALWVCCETTCCCSSSKRCSWSTALPSPEALQWRGFTMVGQIFRPRRNRLFQFSDWTAFIGGLDW